MPKTASLGPDQLDLAIVKELEIDARQSAPELAAKAKRKPITVYRRLRRLLDTGAITFITVPDPARMGFNVSALLGINAQAGKANAVVEYIISYRRFGSVFQTAGRYDILYYTVFRSHEEMFNFLDQDLGGCPYLRNVDSMIVLKVVKSTFSYLSDSFTSTKTALPHDLDEPDLMLIAALESNPRETVANLAKKLGMSRLSTAKRLQTLLQENVIKVVSVVDPPVFGFHIEPTIFVRTHPGKVGAVASELALNQRILHLNTITGNFDIYLRAIFRKFEEMSAFIQNELGNVPGIMYHETMIQVGPFRGSLALLSRQGLLDSLEKSCKADPAQ